MSNIARSWAEAWHDPHYRGEFLLTIPALVVALLVFSRFLAFVETRPGVTFADPLLRLYNPVDLTWVTFGLIYLGLVVGLVFLSTHPETLLLALESYILMLAMRMVSMYLLPFDAPPLLIPLKDPFVQFFGSGTVPTKDLFFSGHTATLFLLFLVVRDPRMKTLFLCCTVGVAFCVLRQHVHFSIDVFCAPFFSYAAYRLAMLLRRLRGQSSSPSMHTIKP